MISLFSGRMGRARYIAWRSGILLVFGLVYIGLSLLIGVLPPGWRLFMGLTILLTVISTLVIYALPAVRRAHDFNASGWLALLSLIPLVSLLFWFIPGTPGVNRHGETPPTNSRRLIVTAVVLPLLAFLMAVFFAVVGAMSYRLILADREATTDDSQTPVEQSGQEP